VTLLLQLVEPREYGKFCESTIVVICDVTSSSQGQQPEPEDPFELGYSIQGDDLDFDAKVSGRHSAMPAASEGLDMGRAEKQAMLDMIDAGL